MANETEQKIDPAKVKTSTKQLLWSMADVTWRMFAGPIVLVPAGLWADLKWGTKPWLTIVAAVAGLGVSVLLVRVQLRGGQ
jgi:hypothetical protein